MLNLQILQHLAPQSLPRQWLSNLKQSLQNLMNLCLPDKYVLQHVHHSCCCCCCRYFCKSQGPNSDLLCSFLQHRSTVHLKMQLVMVNICQLLGSFNMVLCWLAPQKMHSTHGPSLLTRTPVLKSCQSTCPQCHSKLLLDTLTRSAGLVKLCRLHRSTLCQSSVQQRQQMSSAHS